MKDRELKTDIFILVRFGGIFQINRRELKGGYIGRMIVSPDIGEGGSHFIFQFFLARLQGFNFICVMLCSGREQ